MLADSVGLALLVVLETLNPDERLAFVLHDMCADVVASRAMAYASLSPFVRPAIVNGSAGVVVAPRRKPFSVMAFTIRHGKVVAIDSLADPARLARLDLDLLSDGKDMR